MFEQSEVVWCIIAKAVLSVVGSDIQRAACPLQLCAGQCSGVEVAIHSMRTIFTDDFLRASCLLMQVMFFNSSNRAVALRNIQYLCLNYSY